MLKTGMSMNFVKGKSLLGNNAHFAKALLSFSRGCIILLDKNTLMSKHSSLSAHTKMSHHYYQFVIIPVHQNPLHRSEYLL